MTVDEELEIRTPGGSLMPVLASATPILDPRGKPAGAVVVCRDVSAQKELERMRMEWSAIIAHDLRQPVSVVTLAANLARRAHPGPVPEVEAKQLDRIDAAAQRLATMVDELLDASRLEARRMTIAPSCVNVATLACEVCERLASLTAGHPLSLPEARAAPLAWADPARVEQVIANLVSNACKYSAQGSEIRVEVERSNAHVEVTVTNRGPGIDPKELPCLFQRFMRSRASATAGTTGIGLGLYICKGLVEAHGGRIWAESIPGETTSFHFTLPAMRGEDA